MNDNQELLEPNSSRQLATGTLSSLPPENQLIGRVLQGRYRIEEVLGEGGWGTVYRARHLVLEKDVAVKILHLHLSRNTDTVLRLEQEAQILTKMDNNHVIALLDYGVMPTPFLVMEYFRGKTLTEILSSGPMSLSAAQILLEQLCDGLSTAHAAGLVHRDLKPGNILIRTESGALQAKILDFGIARLISQTMSGQRLTATGVALGSPAYMPPEQWMDGAVDDRSDIYALGCIMYEVLAGKPVFTAENSIGYLKKHVTFEPEPLGKVVREPIPRDFERMIMKCLQKKPGDRYSSTAAILADLEDYRHNRRLSIRLVRTPEVYRRQFLIAMACLLAFLTCVATVVYLQRVPLGRHMFGVYYDQAQSRTQEKKDLDALAAYRSALLFADFLENRQDRRKLHSLLQCARLLVETNSDIGKENDSLSYKLNRKAVTLMGAMGSMELVNFANKAEEEFDRRNFAQAEKFGKAAIDMAATLGKHSAWYSQCLNFMGAVSREKKQYPAAIRLHAEALRIAEELLESDDPEFARYCYEFGRTLQAAGQQNEARAMFERATAAGENSYEPLGEPYLTKITAMHLAKRSFDHAVKICRNSVDGRKRLSKWRCWVNDGVDWITPLVRLSEVYVAMHDEVHAIETLKEAIEASHTLKSPPATEAPLWCRLGSVYLKKDCQSDALICRGKALALQPALEKTSRDPILSQFLAQALKIEKNSRTQGK